MNYAPRSIHQWRQTDGYSLALNYYHGGMNFFEPKIHYQGSKDGKAVGEFPILYYFEALIWKINGAPSFFVVRMLNLLIVFCGLFALFKTVYAITRDYFTSYIIPLIIMSSPVFGFYSNSFMVNVPALGFMFISWYFFWRFYIKQQTIWLIFSILFVSLSILLRPTMIIGFMPFYLLWILELFNILKSKIIFKKVLHSLIFLFPIIILIWWIRFSTQYNAESGSIYFLSSIRPIWEANDLAHVWSRFSFELISEFYHSSIRIVLLLLLIAVIYTHKKQVNSLFIFTCLIALGLLFYVLLWFRNFDVHDYYLVELFLLVPPLLVCVSTFLKNNHSSLFYSKFLRTTIVIGVVFSLFHCAAKTRIKYDKKVFFFTELFLSEEEINHWKWYHWDYNERYVAFETVEPYLRSIGIKKTDLVISVPDQSSNVTLALMGQKGFTSMYLTDDEIPDKVDMFKNFGANYLMVNETRYLTSGKLKKYTSHKIGQYKNIRIYQLDK